MDVRMLDEKSQKKHFEEKTKRFHKALSRNNNQIKCSCIGCDNFSINSHTISKESGLRHIAENGELKYFQSRQSGENRELVLDCKGINEATAFKGFCKKHDDMFSNVDAKGIVTKKDLFLQCYRSVSYWNFMEKNASEFLLDVHNDVIDTVRANFSEKFLNKLFKPEEIMGKSAKNILKWKNKFWDLINNFNQDLLLENEMIIDLRDNDYILFKRVNFVIPVALNAKMPYAEGYNLFHIVIPNKDYTDIIVIVNEDKLKIKEAWNARIKDNVKILNTIEGWMIADENWYVSPSIFGALSPDRITKISEDMRFKIAELKLWEFYDASIFDNLRLQFIAGMDENDPRKDFEKAKISNVKLGDRVAREENFRKKYCKQFW